MEKLKTESNLIYYPNCIRVEVIDENGRSYTNWNPENQVKVSMQDDEKTIKIFISQIKL